MNVKKGDKIKVDYTGKLDDGTVFDTTDGKQPLEFEVGSGKVIKAFDQAVMGMEKGSQKNIHIESKDAYGQHNPQMMQKIPREQLPKQPEPKEGMMLLLKSPDGKQFPAKITEIGDKEVTLDLNHPLAGKDLNFDVKVVGIESA
ncbi:peptidylprolyl isomerase [Candidatus Woesearchaeota archaeon]|nr:peptidylprolyl isomerase [Candidatus Woesearchaeota archaeon]